MRAMRAHTLTRLDFVEAPSPAGGRGKDALAHARTRKRVHAR